MWCMLLLQHLRVRRNPVIQISIQIMWPLLNGHVLRSQAHFTQLTLPKTGARNWFECCLSPSTVFVQAKHKFSHIYETDPDPQVPWVTLLGSTKWSISICSVHNCRKEQTLLFIWQWQRPKRDWTFGYICIQETTKKNSIFPRTNDNHIT